MSTPGRFRRTVRITAFGGVVWAAYTSGRRSVTQPGALTPAPDLSVPLTRARPSATATGSGYGWRPVGGDQEHIGLLGGGLPDDADDTAYRAETHPGLDSFGRVGDL